MKWVLWMVLLACSGMAQGDVIKFDTGNPENPVQEFLATVLSLEKNLLRARFENGSVSIERQIHVSRIYSIYFDGRTRHPHPFILRKSISRPVVSDLKKLRRLYVTDDFDDHADCALRGSGQSRRASGNLLVVDADEQRFRLICKQSKGSIAEIEVNGPVIRAWVR